MEIARGLETGEEALRLTEEVARRMGKETVIVRESPGFITSRVNAMIGQELLHRTLGEKYRPAPLLVQHVKAGRLGKNVGRGAYDYAREE